MKALVLRKKLPSDFEIINERPSTMDFKTYKELRRRMNSAIDWYTKTPQPLKYFKHLIQKATPINA
jgi:hypothetical protein